MSIARSATISAIALALVALSAPALAAPTAGARANAKALVAAAKKAARERRYDDAVAALRKADALDPSPATELALARALEGAGKLVEARRALTKLTGSAGATRAGKEAQRALVALAPRVPTVRIEIVGPREASATIDGDDVEASREVPANPGGHAVGASAEGYVAAEKPIDLAEGAHVVVKLRLVRAAAIAAREPEPPPPAPEAKRGSRVPGAVVLSIGAAGLVAGGVLGVLAFNATSAAKAQCAGDVCPPSASGEVSRSKLYGDASTGAFIAGGALAVVGIALIIAAPGGGAQKDEATKAARVTPWIGAGQAGIAGTF